MINKQKHKMSCGPVALTNIMQLLQRTWKGRKFTYDESMAFCKKHLKFSHKKGLKNEQLFKGLSKLGIRYEVIGGVSVRDIEGALWCDKIVILSYTWRNRRTGVKGEHFTLIDGQTEHYFRAWNEDDSHKVPIVSKKRMDYYLRYSNRHCLKPALAVLIKRHRGWTG